MKNIFLIYAVISLFCLKINAQTIVHETISTFKVSYKSSSFNSDAPPEIKVVPHANITLIPSTGASKIYFKILDEITGAIIYQVNYNINSSIITNSSGEKLFENNNDVIFISSGQILPLKQYSYQIQTADNQDNLSTIYSTIQ